MDENKQTEDDQVDLRSHRRAIEYKYRQKAIDEKKYYCEECEIVYRDVIQLTNHINGMKHNPERYITYDCDKCKFYTKNKYDFNRHCLSRKHILNK